MTPEHLHEKHLRKSSASRQKRLLLCETFPPLFFFTTSPPDKLWFEILSLHGKQKGLFKCFRIAHKDSLRMGEWIKKWLVVIVSSTSTKAQWYWTVLWFLVLFKTFSWYCILKCFKQRLLRQFQKGFGHQKQSSSHEQHLVVFAGSFQKYFEGKKLQEYFVMYFLFFRPCWFVKHYHSPWKRGQCLGVRKLCCRQREAAVPGEGCSLAHTAST